MGSGVCEHCGAELPESTQRRRFCNATCRAAAWQAARKDRETALQEAIKALVKRAGMKADDFM